MLRVAVQQIADRRLSAARVTSTGLILLAIVGPHGALTLLQLYSQFKRQARGKILIPKDRFSI
jgi:hypothetical protein